MTRERETRLVTAFLSVYEVTRGYGGPEEGGWYYDSYEWLKVSFPFLAHQEYVWVESDDVMMPGYWEPLGKPVPADYPTEVLVHSVEYQYEAIYGEPDTRHRSSVRPRGSDYIFTIELQPGSLEAPPPRYE